MKASDYQGTNPIETLGCFYTKTTKQKTPKYSNFGYDEVGLIWKSAITTDNVDTAQLKSKHEQAARCLTSSTDRPISTAIFSQRFGVPPGNFIIARVSRDCSWSVHSPVWGKKKTKEKRTLVVLQENRNYICNCHGRHGPHFTKFHDFSLIKKKNFPEQIITKS